MKNSPLRDGPCGLDPTLTSQRGGDGGLERWGVCGQAGTRTQRSESGEFGKVRKCWVVERRTEAEEFELSRWANLSLEVLKNHF